MTRANRGTAKADGAHPVDLAVGANVRRLRLICGFSQETLGAKIGLTFQQIQKYERGANRVCASRLLDIAAALGCALGDLFDGIDQAPSVVSLRQRRLLLLAPDLEALPEAVFDQLRALVAATVAALPQRDASAAPGGSSERAARAKARRASGMPAPRGIKVAS